MSATWNVPKQSNNCSISMFIKKINDVFPLCHSIFFQPFPMSDVEVVQFLPCNNIFVLFKRIYESFFRFCNWRVHFKDKIWYRFQQLRIRIFRKFLIKSFQFFLLVSSEYQYSTSIQIDNVLVPAWYGGTLHIRSRGIIYTRSRQI